MNEDDYWEVYECDNCHNGLIGKEKDNTIGFKESTEYWCPNCLENSIKGKMIASEEGNDVIPNHYLKKLKRIENGQLSSWEKIYFKNK